MTVMVLTDRQQRDGQHIQKHIGIFDGEGKKIAYKADQKN